VQLEIFNRLSIQETCLGFPGPFLLTVLPVFLDITAQWGRAFSPLFALQVFTAVEEIQRRRRVQRGMHAQATNYLRPPPVLLVIIVLMALIPIHVLLARTVQPMPRLP
jgi:hypothetical protein